MGSVSVSEARAALPQILDRVTEGEEVTLTRHGRPIAVLVAPEALRARRIDSVLAAAERVRRLIETGAETSLRRKPRLSEESADALVREVRAGRKRR